MVVELRIFYCAYKCFNCIVVNTQALMPTVNLAVLLILGRSLVLTSTLYIVHTDGVQINIASMHRPRFTQD